MNDESPFRISSMLLTVACLVCGICAVVMLVPRYIQRPKSIAHSTAPSELQLNLAEFHINQPTSAPEQIQPLARTRRSLAPVSSSIPAKKINGSAFASTTSIEARRPAGVSAVPTTHSNFSESAVVDRHVQHWTSPTGSVPQYYAPVTVHPVTVNIDNSGIIREISRVNERLDSLAAETSQLEKNVLARMQDVESAAPKTGTTTTATSTPTTAASTTDSEVRNPATRHEMKLQERFTAPVEQTKTSGRETAQSKTVVTDVASRVEKSNTFMSSRTVERLKTIEQPIDFTSEFVRSPPVEQVASPSSKPSPVPKPVPESDPMTVPEPKPVPIPKPVPVAEIPIEFEPDAPVQAIPEVQFELEPQTRVPDVPVLDLPMEAPESSELQTLPELEFSTDLKPAEGPVSVTPEVVGVPEFELDFSSIPEPVAAVEPEPVPELEFEFAPVATAVDTSVAEVMEGTPLDKTPLDVAYDEVTPPAAEMPVLPALVPVGNQWSKRTTNPPFMNGPVARRSTPPASNGLKAPSRIQQVSHTAESSKQSASHQPCQDCVKPNEKTAYRNKAVSPPTPIQRLRAFFK